MKDKLIIIGLISSAHGVKGHIVITSFSYPAKNILDLPIFCKSMNKVEVHFLKVKGKSDRNFICKLDNCSTRTEAEKFIGKYLYCLRSNFPKLLKKDEFYIEDLKGIKVFNLQKDYIANIINTANYGAGDIIELKFVNHKTMMLPFTKKFFPRITKEYVILALE